MDKRDIYIRVFITGALMIPASLLSSSVPYGVPTIKLVWLMLSGQI